MGIVDSLLSVSQPHGYWEKSHTSQRISYLLTGLFFLYIVIITIVLHGLYFGMSTTITQVYPSARRATLQHSFYLRCEDPKGCIVGTRINSENDSDIIIPPDPSNPCNDFNTQYFLMNNGEVKEVI